jgi:hypothetical protein
VIDCCRVELLRPVSSTPDTPSCAFDVQSIERTWTVCAANEVGKEGGREDGGEGGGEERRSKRGGGKIRGCRRAGPSPGPFA